MHQEPAHPTPEPGEDLCLRCGRCCREKVEIEGVVFYTDHVCRHWDPATRLCTVYERRREVCPECAGVARGIANRIFPRDCPYVRGLEGYDPPVEHWDDPEVEAIIARLPEDPDAVPHPRQRL